MAQFRSTADIVDAVLTKTGEVTNGNSPYDSNGDVLSFLNRVHFSLIAGGTIPIGKDSTIEINETWPWAKARRPLILELQPEITTGDVTLTLASEAGTFSSAPAVSVAGWYLRIAGNEGVYRIASHTAAATAFELDAAWPNSTVTAGTFNCFKLDYDLIPDYIVIDSSNNKVQFQEAAGTTLTATLTSGSYTPSALATEVQTQLNTTGGTPVYTVTYSATTRKFTLASDRGGASVFVLVGTGDQSIFSAHKTLGFDDENSTNAASIVSTYTLGGIARLVEPFRVQKGGSPVINGLSADALAMNYPLANVRERVPDRFAVIYDGDDGMMKVRFNGYPREKTRIELDYVPVPRDLKDSSASIPLVPRRHIDVLEDAAVFYIMLLKSDDRMQVYSQLAQGKLMAMVSQNRASLQKTGKHFGEIVSRKDNVTYIRRRYFNQEPY